MAWSTNISQHADWNKVGDSLEVEYLLALQGFGADDGKVLYIGQSNLSSSAEWTSQYPVVKDGHPFFQKFESDDDHLEYAGYFYNGFPVFGGFDKLMFKSSSGDWVYSTSEPLYYFQTSAIFRSGVESGSDIRTLIGISCSTNCYKSNNSQKIDDELDEYGTTYNFTRIVDGGNLTLTGSNVDWKRESGLSVNVDGSPYSWLSSFLGTWKATHPTISEEDVVIGNGSWKNGDSYILETGVSDEARYIVSVVSNGNHLKAIVVESGGTFSFSDVLINTGFSNPVLDDFSALPNGSAYLTFNYTGGSLRTDFTWNGWTLGDGSKGGMKFASHPWYRQIG